MMARALLQRCACGGRGAPCADCQRERGGFVAPPIVHEVLREPGHALDAATRGAMEGRLGHDFSHVRVHADARAAASAGAVGARAYAVGRHVVLGESARSDAGTLAHELVHAAQQGDAPIPAPGALRVGATDAPQEREAEAHGARARGEAPVLRRQPAGGLAQPDVGCRVVVRSDGRVEVLCGGQAPIVGTVEGGIRIPPGGQIGPVVGDGTTTYSWEEILRILRGIGSGGPGSGSGGGLPFPLPQPGGGPTLPFPLPGTLPPLTVPPGTGPQLQVPNLQLPGLLGGPMLGPLTSETFDHFTLDSDALPSDAATSARLDDLAGRIALHPDVTIHVDGHTDRSGTPQHNVGLSRRRAEAVRDALVARGVDAARLRVEAKGESEPLFPAEGTPEERARNRRVEVWFFARRPSFGSGSFLRRPTLGGTP